MNIDHDDGTLSDNPRRETSTSIETGKTLLGRFEVLGRLGAGTMGTVYKCRNRNRPDEILAIKILSSRASQNDMSVRRFKNELHVSYRVSNSNVVRGREFFTTDQFMAFTMEYIEGASLADIMYGGQRLEIKQIECILAQLASGLRAIHAAGIIHRDLKPHNIIVSVNGDVKITDFSAAKFYSPTQGFSDNAVIGSVDYMSPEALKDGEVDSRSDIYALGIVGYEMITGRLPFKGENLFNEVNKKLSEKAVAPHIIRPDCPRDLSDLIMHAMHANPKKRFQTVDEFLFALESRECEMVEEEDVEQESYFSSGAESTSAAILDRPLPTISRTTAIILALLLFFMPLLAVSSPPLRFQPIDFTFKGAPEVTVVRIKDSPQKAAAVPAKESKPEER